MSLRTHEDTRFTVPLKRNNDPTLYHFITSCNYVRRRDLGFKKNGGKEIDCTGDKHPKKDLWSSKVRRNRWMEDKKKEITIEGFFQRSITLNINQCRRSHCTGQFWRSLLHISGVPEGKQRRHLPPPLSKETFCFFFKCIYIPYVKISYFI